MEKKGSSSLTRYSVLVLIGAIVTKKLSSIFTTPEPQACAVMRNALLATQRANDLMLEKNPSVPGTFPNIPLQMIQDCGAGSWRMPYPYVFKFTDSPLNEEELVKVFLERDKEVRYRDNVEGVTARFGKSVGNRAQPIPGSFAKAWECISKGTCSMYFDNTWSKEDYQKIIPKGIFEILSTNKYGSMFMSNSPKFFRTVSAHAENSNSVSLQMLNNKTWEIIPPYFAKKYLGVTKAANIALIDFNAANQTKLLEHVPHYRFTARPGDGFYFPGYYFHIVYNDPGVNVMTSWRQLGHVMDIIKRSPLKPLETLHHLFITVMTERVLPESIYKKLMVKMSERRQINPLREKREYYIDMMYELNKEE